MRRFNAFCSIAGLLVLLGAVVVFTAGCQNDTPTAPSSIYISNVNTNTQGGASPPPDASGSLPAGSTVRVEVFGASCASGANPRPNPGELKLGCSLAATCTPRGPDGVPLPASVHGPNVFWSPASSSVLRVVPDGAQPFNVSVFAQAVGSDQVSCLVKGVSGSLSLTVVP